MQVHTKKHIVRSKRKYILNKIFLDKLIWMKTESNVDRSQLLIRIPTKILHVSEVRNPSRNTNSSVISRTWNQKLILNSTNVNSTLTFLCLQENSYISGTCFDALKTYQQFYYVNYLNKAYNDKLWSLSILSFGSNGSSSAIEKNHNSALLNKWHITNESNTSILFCSWESLPCLSY